MHLQEGDILACTDTCLQSNMPVKLTFEFVHCHRYSFSSIGMHKLVTGFKCYMLLCPCLYNHMTAALSVVACMSFHDFLHQATLASVHECLLEVA